MANKNLSNAKNAKNDEFYTQLNDIQAEVNAYIDYDPDVFRGKTVLLPCDDPEWSNFTRFFAQNFERFGLKKLISTSYAAASKNISATKDIKSRKGKKDVSWYQPTLFEKESPQYDEEKTAVRGKIFVLDHDTNKNGKIDFKDLEWEYLEGDGDFRSEEVCKLRDEADMIVTNPPFSLFREFLAWIVGDDGKDVLTQRRRGAESVKGGLATSAVAKAFAFTKATADESADKKSTKKFLIIGNQNAITYKEVFPLIKANKMWLGKGFKGGAAHFISKYTDYATAGDHRAGMIRVSGVVWFTNLEHGRRHQPLRLMTIADNIKFSKHKEVRGKGYQKYDNYDAIEVPFTDAIPGDYDGVMGVPVSFLDKYCPEQFEIVGSEKQNEGIRTKIYPEQIQVEASGKRSRVTKLNDGAAILLPEAPSGVTYYQIDDAAYAQVYKRIFIRARRPK